MGQQEQPDGTIIVTLTGGGRPVGHRMHVRDLWGEHEEVLDEVVIPPGPPAWIRDRLEQAGRGP